MATTTELGQKIKAKYPGSYDDMSDNDVGVKTKAKYPGAYDDFTDKPSLETLKTREASAKQEASRSIGSRFMEALPGAAADVLLKGPARFVSSAIAAPTDIFRGLTGKMPVDVKLPFVGESFQSEAAKKQKQIVNNEAPMYEALTPFAQVPLAGIEAATLPGLTKGVKKGVVDPILGMARNAITRKAEKKTIDFALDLTSRQVTKGSATEAMSKGSEGYQAPGFFSKAKIKPTPQDVKVAEATAPYVKSGQPVQKSIDSMKEGIAQTNSGVRGMIADNKIPFNEAQLRTKLGIAKQDSKLMFAGDSAAEKTYDTVIDEFIKFVNKGKKDTLGLFDSRQSFDSYIQRKFPNVFKKDATGQFLDPKDSLRSNAILDIRRAANEYIAEQLPVNNPYRKALLQESYLFDGIGRIVSKNYGVIGKNKIQLLTEEYPILKGLVGKIALATGLLGSVGIGASILNSSD